MANPKVASTAIHAAYDALRADRGDPTPHALEDKLVVMRARVHGILVDVDGWREQQEYDEVWKKR
jgi:hypothetical protein